MGRGGENEREREIDRSENEAKFKSARERREASGHHSHVSPFWKLRLHAGEPRKIVRGDAVCGWITATQAEAGLANFSSPCGSRLAAAGCAFNIGRIWAGWGWNITNDGMFRVYSFFKFFPPFFAPLFIFVSLQDKLLSLYYLSFLFPFLSSRFLIPIFISFFVLLLIFFFSDFFIYFVSTTRRSYHEFLLTRPSSSILFYNGACILERGPQKRH